MNYLRTAILLAGLTALFMGVGYLLRTPFGQSRKAAKSETPEIPAARAQSENGQTSSKS